MSEPAKGQPLTREEILGGRGPHAGGTGGSPGSAPLPGNLQGPPTNGGPLPTSQTSTLLPGQKLGSMTFGPEGKVTPPPPRNGDGPLAADRLSLPPPVVQDKARLTVVETVYFQAPGSEPHQASSNHARFLESDEQPYQRTSKVGEEWVDLDLGWLKDVGASQVVVENLGPKPTGVAPTADERAEIARQVVEVGYRVDAVRQPANMLEALSVTSSVLVTAVVRPGASMRFEPHFVLPRLRCRHGSVRVSVNVFPK